MHSATQTDIRYHVNGRAFGCDFAVTVPDRLAEALAAGLPVGWQPGAGEPHRRWELVESERGWAVLADGIPVSIQARPEPALHRLLDDLESWTAAHADGLVAVLAGAVAWRGRVIALPRRPGTGTTTLVAALVRAGAGYLSDRFLLLTPDGRALPYRCPLRPPGEIGADHHPGSEPDRPLPLALVTRLVHSPGARWDVRPLSPGHTVLALADSALGVRSRSREVMEHVLAAVPGTTGVAGTRGEADAAAQHILGSCLP